MCIASPEVPLHYTSEALQLQLDKYANEDTNSSLFGVKSSIGPLPSGEEQREIQSDRQQTRRLSWEGTNVPHYKLERVTLVP